jgi:ATP-dependent DNA ligase
MAGSLEIGVLRDGKVYPLGWLSGLTDEMKTNYKNYKGKCLEVAAMQFTDDKALRHAKMVQLRPDLTIQDCTWDKLGI